MYAIKLLMITASLYQIDGATFNAGYNGQYYNSPTFSGSSITTPYCYFQCGYSQKTKAEGSKTEAKTPSGYYWREFYGVIPPDALPLAVSSQSPKAYIGLTYDVKNDGYFVGTIHDGMNYMYITKEGNITKIDKHIRILCTESTEKLGWFKLTKEVYDKLEDAGNSVLNFGAYKSSAGEGVYQYIARTRVNDVSYIGGAEGFTKKLEYACEGGQLGSSLDFEWLMYNPKNITTIQDLEPKSRRPFFNRNFQYQFGGGSFIPRFHEHINLGSCSLTCTNMGQNTGGQNNQNGAKRNTKLLSSLAYYWQVGQIADFTQAIPSGGIDVISDKPSYIGKSPVLGLNFIDVGSGDEHGSTIDYKNNGLRDPFFFHILSSNYQEKFKWVETTSDDFPNLDKDALIPGGYFENGTETYVCRNFNDRHNVTTPGSARVLSTGTLCFSYMITTKEFDVLMFQPDEK